MNAIIAGPTRNPIPFGLFSVLTFPNTNERWNTGATFQGSTCGPASTVPLDCDTPDSDMHDVTGENSRKMSWQTVEPFAVYGHFQCSPVGFSLAEAQVNAEADLIQHEEAGVEDFLWKQMSADTEVEALTSTGFVEAVAEMELIGAREYGVQGVIHLPRDLAVRGVIEGIFEAGSGRLSTVLGTPVAAYSVKADSPQVFLTPPMVARRSEIYPIGEAEQLFDRGHNIVTTVAQRDYLIGFDSCSPYTANITL